MFMRGKIGVLALTALLAACAPTANKPQAQLFPISQGEFLEYVKRAEGSVYISGPDLTSTTLAQTLAQIPFAQANIVLLVERQALSNQASQVPALAKTLGRSRLNMVMVATIETRIKPFAYVGGKAFYGPGLLADGEMQMAGAGYDFGPDLERFNTIPKRIYFGQ